MTRLTLIDKYRGMHKPESSLNIHQELFGNLNNNPIYPINEAIYYQCKDVGTPLNEALRKKTSLNSVFTRITTRFDEYFDKCEYLSQNVVLYRGIPDNILSKHSTGDIIHDRAFMSTSINPAVSAWFSNETSMLEIILTPRDKALCLRGDYFFNETLECILPRNLKLKIMGMRIEQGDYPGRKCLTGMKIYEVVSLGQSEKTEYGLDLQFDTWFVNFFTDICDLLIQNDGVCRSERLII